jgi:hypothetical protein
MSKEISVNELFKKFKIFCNYLVAQWKYFILAISLGAIVGSLYNYFAPINYDSRVSFVVEDSKASAGGIAALAGQLGFDLSGMGVGGFLGGENILLYLKSEDLIRETLLTRYENKSEKTLADVYADSRGLKKKWLRKLDIQEINFPTKGSAIYSRTQDSLLKVIIYRIIKKDLEIVKPDKKATFIEVNVNMRDELLAKYFSERLVKIAIQRYIDFKLRYKSANVKRLEARSDSILYLLNYKTSQVASTQQNLIDINPALRNLSVSSEIIGRDRTMLGVIYAEVVKNLEISRIALSQETPVIEVVDYSYLPLKNSRLKLYESILLFSLFAFLGLLMFLVGRFVFNHGTSEMSNQ